NVRDLTGGLTLHGHTDGILDVAFTPGGRQLLTVANVRPPAPPDAVAIDWIGRNGGAGGGLGHFDDGFGGLRSLGGGQGGLGGFGQYDGISTPPWGGPAWEVKRWDVDGGFAVATLPGHVARLKCAAFSPKAGRVAVGGEDNTVRVWDTQTGRELVSVPLSGAPSELAFGPRGDFLAVLVSEGKVSRILILDATTGRERRAIAPRMFVVGLALSPDGRTVAGSVAQAAWSAAGGLGGFDRRIQVWSVESGAERTLVTLPSGQSASSVLAFSPDGGLLAGVTSDETVTLWDAQTGEKRLQLKVHSGAGRLAFSADGERLATANSDGLVKVLDTRTRQEVYSFQGGHRLAFSADNAALAAANMTAVVGATPSAILLSAKTVPTRTYLEGSSGAAVFSPDGRLVAARGPENDVLFFDAFTGKRLRPLKGHRYSLSSLGFSADGKRLVSLSRGGTADGGKRLLNEVIVWDVETGKQLALFEDFDNKLPLDVAVSADGARVAVRLLVQANGTGAVQGHEIHVLDVATGRRLRPITFAASTFPDRRLAFA
ncbi:MAG TPA: WD40 repeat domain-containing protein, partial [Gemmataceae bacterium]|nr:WD40 repeat domain-containing protein [Gemmataceae bacterium]